MRPARLERRGAGFGGQHAGLHGVVAALDARQVDEAGAAADQRPAGKGQLRHRLRAALGDGARAIADALAAFENLRDGRMGLGALEFGERVQPRILIIQMHHKADRAKIVAPVVHEQAAAGLIVQRPAHAVQHKALFVLGGGKLPQFLQPDAELLRLAGFVQVEGRAQLF